MWMLEKSAGDEVTFVAVYVDGEMGHSYEYANALANKVTLAMIATQQNAPQTTGTCTCETPVFHPQGYCGYCGLPIPTNH